MSTGETQAPNHLKLWALVFSGVADSLTEGLVKSEQAAMTHINTTPPPTYTALDRSKEQFELGLEEFRPDAGISVPSQYLSTAKNPLFAAAIDARKVEKMFGTIFKAASVPHEAILQSYQLFLAATTMLPDALIPSLGMQLADSAYGGPMGHWDPSTFSIDIFIFPDKPFRQQIATAVRHEFHHLLQVLRGIQLGNNMEALNLDNPFLTAAARVYLPTLGEGDPTYDDAKIYYQATGEHNLLKTLLEAEYASQLMILGAQRLFELAKIFGVRKQNDIYAMSTTLYKQLKQWSLPLTPKQKQALTPIETELIQEIWGNERQLYMMNPAEAEVMAIERFGAGAGNLFLTTETADQRGLLQMPADAAARSAQIEQLVQAAEIRKRDYLLSGDPFNVQPLLGGTSKPYENVVITKYPTWFDFANKTAPSIEDLNRLAEEVGRKADLIATKSEAAAQRSLRRLGK